MRAFGLLFLLVLIQARIWANEPALPEEGGVVVRVHGTVKRQGPDGETPVLEATVRLISESLGVRTAFTDENGEFDFYKVKPGDYELNVQFVKSVYLYQVSINAAQATTILKPIVLGEWVYYGNRAHPGDSEWTDLWFTKVSGDSKSLPEKGDIVIPTKELSVRQGAIFRRGKDLLLQKATGKEVAPGQRLKVLEVREPFPGSPPDLEDGSVWIRFLTLSSAQ